MGQKKRYHPLNILFDFWRLLKNAFFFVLFLFIINYDSSSAWINYGRIIFCLAVVLTVFSIIYKWFTQKYLLDDVSFHMYKGLFNKSERTIPYTKIHNIQRRQTFIHKLFGLASVVFETSMTDTNASIKFGVISQKELNELEARIHQSGSTNHDVVAYEAVPEAEKEEQVICNRTVHFRPTRKDTIKASFTSLSFLVLIPIIVSVSSEIEDIFDIEDKAKTFLMSNINSWWIISLFIVALVIMSVAFGVVRTFLRYGRYEIASDDKTIFISKGILEESTFTISKDKVQAVEVTQSLIKRMLGLAEVKLISAGSVGESEDETNSLYPFLPVQRAYEMLEEVLPDYEVTQKMYLLPGKSLWVRLLRPSWLWIIATIALFFFRPQVFDVKQAWWIISVFLFLIIYIHRILDFINTRYMLNGGFIQFKTGSLQTTMFVSKRKKVIEVEVSRSRLQKQLGLSTINMVNRSKPVHHTMIKDVPELMANAYRTWYIKRTEDIEIEKTSI